MSQSHRLRWVALAVGVAILAVRAPLFAQDDYFGAAEPPGRAGVAGEPNSIASQSTDTGAEHGHVTLNNSPGGIEPWAATDGSFGNPDEVPPPLPPEDGGPETGCDFVEGEPVCANGYVDNFNGGCNSTPNVFDQIACGQTVCGEYGTFLSAGGANFRDTDWYTFTLPAPSNVIWTATGGAITRVFILNSNCPATSLGTAVAPAGSPATVSLNLAAGTYRGFVGTEAFTGVPCGTEYVAQLIGCKALLGDLNCDGKVDGLDVTAFTLAILNPALYQARYPNCDIDLADTNLDSLETIADIPSFVALLLAP